MMNGYPADWAQLTAAQKREFGLIGFLVRPMKNWSPRSREGSQNQGKWNKACLPRVGRHKARPTLCCGAPLGAAPILGDLSALNPPLNPVLTRLNRPRPALP